MDSSLADSLTGGGIVLSGAMVMKLAEMWFAARRAREQKTEISPTPLPVEQSSQQALWKDNAKDHADIFDRLRKVEAETAAQRAEIENTKTMQGRMFDMISALYDRIIGGKKK